MLVAGCGQSRDRSADAFPGQPSLAPEAPSHSLRTVFVILLENRDWSSVVGSAAAPYVNGVLLPRFAHAESYRNGGLRPSLASYVTLEAGDPLGVTENASPSQLPLPVAAHLTAYLDAVGVSWRAYQEGIDGTTCPIADTGTYVAHHDPFVYFEDVSGSPPSSDDARCIEHVRPYAELARDLAAGTVARYDFITPDVCHDGHDPCPPQQDPIRQADDWLAREIPALMASRAYQDGGVILIVWDEPTTDDHPIGLIAVSPLAKPGYGGMTPYSHASTLRTVQEILGVVPLLRRAATASSLSDLFTTYP